MDPEDNPIGGREKRVPPKKSVGGRLAPVDLPEKFMKKAKDVGPKRTAKRVKKRT